MLEKSYNPQDSEQKIYKKWEEQGLLKASEDKGKPVFSLVMPPPNVTGSLHMGHALDDSLPDVVLRYKRMKGYDVLWQPGMDHAGIATQMVVERELAKESVSKHDLGREKFVEKVWEWKEKSGGQILNQLRRLGASADWSRGRFTMDEGLSKAVAKVFVTLYKEGLIYKDKRLVNWDSKLQTAISDVEVEQKETVGKMWYFRYLAEDNKDEYITVATTRPETMFGDMAVAVAADDERYKHLIGKNVLIPIVNRPIPVITDEHADKDKGTGAVKITPAHDFNDFEVGKRHNLQMINILDKYARLNENVPPEYQGMTCLEARPLVLEKIKELGQFVKEEDNPMSIPYGDRSGVIIEPWLTDQWYVDAAKLAPEAIRVVETDEIQFIPASWKNTYFEWMRNIQPWCISRQLWWGHRIPVWYAEDGTEFCEETEELAYAAAEKHFGKKVELTRDSDVLDTWFSSALWPFTTLSWPDEDSDYLKRYYPTSLLITGFDIIFFWVARMIMMGMHFKKQIPFKQVLFHGLVRDGKGQKMSKSKKNGIDPLDLIAKYGADALRFALLIQAGQGRDVLISDSRCEAYRNFATKVWNAARFCEMNGCFENNWAFNPLTAKSPVNVWILSKFADAAKKIGKDIESYAINEACSEVYHFVWDCFCDWYLELIKPVFFGENEAEKAEVRATAAFVLEGILKILHPFMPFITEELWANTAERNSMLMAQEWPDTDFAVDESKAAAVDMVIGLISLIRSTKVSVNIPASTKVTIKLKDTNAEQKDIITSFDKEIKTLAKLSEITFDDNLSKGDATAVYNGMTVMLPIADFIDVEKEKSRLNKEAESLEAFIKSSNAQLNNEAFTSKAPASVVEGKVKARDEAMVKLDKINEALKIIMAIN